MLILKGSDLTVPSAGTSAVTLRWNSGSGLPPSSLYRYPVQGAPQGAPPWRMGQEQRDGVIGIRVSGHREGSHLQGSGF